MDNGKVMTALELAIKMVRSRTSGVTQRQRGHKMQEQHEHVVYPLWLSLYEYFIYCGRSHLYYSFCADNFYGLFSMMCLQLTLHTISQQPARSLLSAQLLSISLITAINLRRFCWTSFTACSLSSAILIYGYFLQFLQMT
jgi:hypothetical protein